MKVKVLKKTANEMKIEIEDEGHTFCNALQKAMIEDENIEIAGYDISHPLVANPIVTIRTRERHKPEVALRKAAEKIRDRTREFRKSFESALKEYGS